MIARLLHVVWLSLACTSAFAATLAEDMVALDRAYIPALAITNRKPPPAPDLARRAMDRLNAQWAAFRGAQGGARPKDPNWRADLDKIDAMIAAANKVVAGGTDVAQAHEALEGVRITFMHMRERAGVPYYLDHLTRFHDVMEEIHDTAQGKTAATLTDADVAKVRAAFARARKLWSAVLAAKADPEFKLDATQQARLAKLLAAESSAMTALETALAGTDRGAVAKTAQSIRQPFAALYISFGDFAPVEAR